MLRHLLKRMLFAILVVLAVQLIVFFLTHLLGSPARLMLPATASAEEVARLDHQLGYDRPLHEQLLGLITGTFTGDFGQSYWQKLPAAEVVFGRLPATLLLVALAMGLAVLIAIPLGTFAATQQGRLIDRLITAVSLLGVSMPAFWIGYLLILFFSVQLGWLPTSGIGGPLHPVLPTLALAALPIGRLTQIVRTAMLNELGQQYMLVGRAFGLPPRTRLFRHALKNAGIPILTMTGWEVSRLISGFTVLVEVVFSWPGIGQLTVQAINHRDVPLLIASVTVVSIVIVALNLLLDVLYTLIDPRLRAPRGAPRSRSRRGGPGVQPEAEQLLARRIEEEPA